MESELINSQLREMSSLAGRLLLCCVIISSVLRLTQVINILCNQIIKNVQSSLIHFGVIVTLMIFLNNGFGHAPIFQVVY